MNQQYTELKTDNTSSSLISLNLNYINLKELMLGIRPRSAFQAKKTSGCDNEGLFRCTKPHRGTITGSPETLFGGFRKDGEAYFIG